MIEIVDGKIKLPLEYYLSVKQDPRRFLRDRGCFRIGAIVPYFTEAMFERCFVKGKKNPLDERWLRLDDDFRLYGDPRPRFGHGDLGLTQDGTGVAVVHISDFIKMPMLMCACQEDLDRRIVEGRCSECGKQVQYRDELLPVIEVDFLGYLSPQIFPKKRTVISNVRQIFFEAKERRYMNLVMCTWDGFQSEECIHIFNTHGILSGRLSIDNTSQRLLIDGNNLKKEATSNPAAAMDCLWALLNDRRLKCPRHPWLLKEAKEQERDDEKAKVYKIPGGSDDLIQALAGACFNGVSNMRLVLALQTMDAEEKQPRAGERMQEEIERQEDAFYDDSALDDFTSDEEKRFRENFRQTYGRPDVDDDWDDPFAY